MKSLRLVIVIGIACAVSSAAPAVTEDAKSAKPADESRRQAVEKYFEAPAGPDNQPRPDPKDPRWVQSMQRMLKELAADNANLRLENEGLRADVEALKRQFEAEGLKLQRQKENRGALVLPPQAFQGQLKDTVPKEWSPFEFNGATYYIVPLRDGEAAPAARLLRDAPPPKQ
jgi:hypothetical protein